MEHSLPDDKRRALAGDADRLIGWMRRGTVGLGGLLALLALLVVFFSAVEPATFPRGTTLQAMMFQVPELGLLSLAMAVPLISGGINLAIIATANLSGLLMAWILVAVMPPEAAGSELRLVAGRRAGRRPRAVCWSSASSPACWSRSSACIRSW